MGVALREAAERLALCIAVQYRTKCGGSEKLSLQNKKDILASCVLTAPQQHFISPGDT